MSTSNSETLEVKAIVTALLPQNLSNLSIAIDDLVANTFLLEFVSTELDPHTGMEKETLKTHVQAESKNGPELIYQSDNIDIPANFGEVGAVCVENEHEQEMFLVKIQLTGLPKGTLTINCSSWAHPKSQNPVKRIFFTNKCYLPSQTPEGLKSRREMELETLRGDGKGERKTFDRIYDYDVYDDLGNPDESDQKKRPALGGKAYPYPRRCRTGRPRSVKDPSSEQRSSVFYVPRDEVFSKIKGETFTANEVVSVLHSLIPQIEALGDPDQSFESFKGINELFDENIQFPQHKPPGLFAVFRKALRFEAPELYKRDKHGWSRDEEFARQTVAGMNPFSIQLVKGWPLKSNLNPMIYGDPVSLITKELIEQEIEDTTTLEEALNNKKLFMLDYHDLFLPYVNKVRELKGTTLYGSRTLFFLKGDGTLRPLAIELTQPPRNDEPQWRQVYTPRNSFWPLAKAHVLAHDSAYHELVAHWLRSHCCTEPYIIAANRQLSAMHPIYRLLCPHFRFTMEINALARKGLINAGGIIETTFSAKNYSMEFSSAAYDKLWRFDMESLPADLIRRGMAFEDPNAKHGLQLTIPDYPYAKDGLDLWFIIKKWVTNYVSHYYPTADLIESDEELQAWWTEVRTRGHEDKKDEPWWLVLKNQENLVQVMTTIIWVASAHHAAANFGQYMYGGYFPNRPTIARTDMPTEVMTREMFDTETAFLQCFPSKVQATTVMAVFEVLSNHSPDEEYLGKTKEPSWEEDLVISNAFEQFAQELGDFENIINKRNNDQTLRNRNGFHVLPYELLKPVSGPGVTGKGVPNSISI